MVDPKPDALARIRDEARKLLAMPLADEARDSAERILSLSRCELDAPPAVKAGGLPSRQAPASPDAEFCTAAEIAGRLRLSLDTVYDMWHDGRLPEPLLPTARAPRWRAADIDRWIAGGCKPAQLKAYRRKPRTKKGGAA